MRRMWCMDWANSASSCMAKLQACSRNVGMWKYGWPGWRPDSLQHLWGQNSKPVSHLYCSRKSSLKLSPRCVIHLQTVWGQQWEKGKIWSHLSWWCCDIHLTGTAFESKEGSSDHLLLDALLETFSLTSQHQQQMQRGFWRWCNCTWFDAVCEQHLGKAVQAVAAATHGHQPENHYCLKDNKHGEWLCVCLKASDTLVKWEEIIWEWIRAQIC